MKIKTICMLSTHGYFDPVPQLGRTDTGGQVVYVLKLAEALAKQGIKVDIFTRWFDKERQQINPLPGCPGARVIRIPAGEWEFIPKEKIYSILPELSKNMISFIKDNNLDYDLFHAHYVDAGIVMLDVAKAFDKPAFFTAHSLGAWKQEQMRGDQEELEKKFNFRHRIAEELKIFRSISAQTVTTQLQLEKIEQLYGLKPDNIAVISPGVDIERFKPTDFKDRPELPRRYIFYLSRIDSNKGHDLLLNAFDIVRKKIKDIHLIIGGGSPNPKSVEREVIDNMKKIIDEKDMHRHVTIIGYVPDDLVAPYYSDAELFVLPSLFEPFGMTVLEAMACNTPVIASKFGGIKDIINSGKNGILTDASKPEEFAEAILTILDNKDLAKTIAEAGRKTILKEFSWEAIAKKHLEFYGRFTK